MDWNAVGAVGEVAGAIAVLVTLVYLATQVRHSSQQTRLALSQARTEANRALISLGLEDKILEAHIKADMAFAPEPLGPMQMLMSKAALSREEATRVFMVFLSYWNYVVQIVPVVEILSEPERQQFDSFIRNRFRSPGTYGEIYKLWRVRRDAEYSSIVAYVDAILESK